MNLQARYEEALAFTREKHKNQYRIGGAEYITHPIGVAEIVRSQGYGIDYQLAALFHDMFEDTDATEEEILRHGNEEILEAVKALTKPKGYVMEEYIAGIKRNPIAYVVKAADRLHNLQSALLTDNEFKRKYAVETINWYLDFCDQIPYALVELLMSMEPIWKNRMSFVWCLKVNSKVIMEGALKDRLLKEYGIALDKKLDLPCLVHKEEGRIALKDLWKSYAKIAEQHNLPFLAMTPTRNLNKDTAEGHYYPEGIIIDNVAHLNRVREECNCEMYMGAYIGCKEDNETCQMSAEEYQEFHEWEIEKFARAGIDFYYASMISNIEEAVGIAKAISITKIPYIMGFVINEDGCLLDGTTLTQAITRIDKLSKHKPALYMANDVPVHVVMQALKNLSNQDESVSNRFLGIQPNAINETDVEDIINELIELNRLHPMKVFGGSTGIEGKHLELISTRV